MRRRIIPVRTGLASVTYCVLALAGCGGGGDDGAAGGGGTGIVTDEWQGYCTGTFTEDTQILDPFGDPIFTARVGDEYLLSAYGGFAGEVRAEFLYLTSRGPDEFDVTAGEAGTLPFTSNCAADAGVPYYAVFADTSVYAEVALTTKICDLAAGTALPATTGPRGYSAASNEFSLTGPQTYEVFLNAFSGQCGGAESGFVSVPQTEVLGTHTWLVPIIGIIGPA